MVQVVVLYTMGILKKKEPRKDERRTHQFVCVEVLRSIQPNGVMLSAVSLPNHMFTGQT